MVELLNGNPNVHCDGEILERPVLLPTEWVTVHRNRHSGCAYGFKVKLYQLTIDQALDDPDRWLATMHQGGWCVIYLWRRNLLRHVLSNIVALNSGRYRRRVGSTGAEPTQLRVDPARVLQFMRLREQLGEQERAALAGVPHETVCYEDDLMRTERHQATVGRLGKALRLKLERASTTLRPINSRPLPDMVANYEELERALAGTRWHAYLDT